MLLTLYVESVYCGRTRSLSEITPTNQNRLGQNFTGSWRPRYMVAKWRRI